MKQITPRGGQLGKSRHSVTRKLFKEFKDVGAWHMEEGIEANEDSMPLR
jgi:hypothetical protein